MAEILFRKVAEWLDAAWPFEPIIYPGREISWGEFIESLDNHDEQFI